MSNFAAKMHKTIRGTKRSALWFFASCVIAVVASTTLAHAAFNKQLNYQGKLTNASNVAVANGTYNMEFKLYTVSSGGVAVWTETRTGADKVQVTNGLFSVLLGEVNSLSGVDFNQTLYLGVNIGGTGSPSWDGEMTPRKKLGAVPAAIEAENLGGASASQYLRSDIAAASSVTDNTNAAFTIAQLGTGNIFDVFDGATKVLTVLDGGNVGIGDTTPLALFTVGNGDKFQVDGSGNATLQNQGELRLGDADGSNYIGLKAPGTIASNFTWTLPSSDSAGCLQSDGSGNISISSCGGSGSSALSSITAATGTNTINNGNFAQEWEWNGLGAATGFKLSSVSTAAASNLQKLFEIDLSGANAFGSQTTYGMYVSNTHTGSSATNVGGYFSASGGTNNYGLLVANGNVGIGTTTPANKLQIENGAIGLSGTGNEGVSFTTSNSFGLNYLDVTAQTPGNGIAATYHPNTSGVGLPYAFQFSTSDGNESSLLFVGNRSTASHVIAVSNDATDGNPWDLVFRVTPDNTDWGGSGYDSFTIKAGAPTNSLYVDSDGKVGVGTTPIASLDVISNLSEPSAAFSVDTANPWSLTSSRLASFKSAGSEMLAIRPDGAILSGPNTASEFMPSPGYTLASTRDVVAGDEDFNGIGLRVDGNVGSFDNYVQFGTSGSTSTGWHTYQTANVPSGNAISFNLDTADIYGGELTLESTLSGQSSKFDFLTKGDALTFTGTVNATDRWRFDPSVANGSSSVGYLFDTETNLSVSGAKIASFGNHGVEKFSVDKDGNTVASGTVTGTNISGTNTGDVTLAGENYLSLAGQVITANAVNLSNTNVTGTLAAARFGALTGDVTTVGGTYATTIANNAVTYAKFQQVAANSLVGNATGSTASASGVGLGAGLAFVGGNLVTSNIPNASLQNSLINLAIGTTGTDAAWSASSVSLGGTTTLNIPDAGSSARGLITTGTQTIAGAKTFSSKILAQLATEQLRLGYDASNYQAFTVGSDGGMTVAGTTGSTLGVGNSFAGITLSPNAVTEAGSGTHTLITGVTVNAPTITDGAATTTKAVSLYVAGAPTSALNNYAFDVAGTSLFENNITLSNGIFSTGAFTSSTSTLGVTETWAGSTTTTLSRNTFKQSASSNLGVGNNFILSKSTTGVAVTEAASGTHNLIAAFGIQPLTVTDGIAATTNGATLYIEGAATGTATITNNYALWVNSGLSRFGGAVQLGSVSDATGDFLTINGSTGAIQRRTAAEVLTDVGALSSSTSSTQNGFFGNISLQDDTSPSHYLTLTDAEDLSANHTLALSVGNADRILTLSGNAMISGTNTGDLTLAAVGSSPNANGASLSGQVLTLQPADGSNPGVITAGTQTIGGNKTFNGNIGIGTTSPGATLGIVDALAASSGREYGIRLKPTVTQTGTAGYSAIFVDVTETTTGSGYNDLAEFKVGGTTVLEFGNDGAISSVAGFKNTSSSNNSYVQTLTTGTKITRNVADANAALIVAQQNASSTGDILQLQNSGGTVFAVKQDGNVGIGTATPGTALQIKAGTNQGVLIGDGDGGATPYPAWMGTNGLFVDGNFRAGSYLVASDGEINWGASQVRIEGHNPSSGSDTYLSFYTGGIAANGERMRIIDNGNVGIGTTTPSDLLTVDTGASKRTLIGDIGLAGFGGTLAIGNGGMRYASGSYTSLLDVTDLGTISIGDAAVDLNGTLVQVSDMLGNISLNATNGFFFTGGNMNVSALDTDNTAPTTTGTTKMVITDSNGQLSFAPSTVPTGTNTGDVTLSAVGSSPNANGASISGQALTLQPADGTNPGVLTTGAQTIAGVKTFSSRPVVAGLVTNSTPENGNLTVNNGSSWTTTASSYLTFEGASTVGYRILSRGVSSTSLASNQSYANVIWGEEAVTEGGSGTHALLANSVFKPLAITGGGAAVANTATVYIEGASSATVTGSNNALWVKSGTSTFGGDIVISELDTDNAAPTTTGTTKMVITDANGQLSFTTIPSGGATTLNSVIAATGANTINNANYLQEWQWNSLTTGVGMRLSSTSVSSGTVLDLVVNSTAAASDSQKVLNISTAGVNGTTGMTTYGAYISNSHSGTSSTNIAMYLSATGGTSNRALIIPDGGGRVGIGTTSPAYLLDVVENSTGFAPSINIANADTGTVSYAQLAFTGSGRTYGIGVGNSTETLNSVANKFFIYDSTGTAMRFVIDSNGSVGIGDTTPNSLFTVGASDAFQINGSGQIVAGSIASTFGSINIGANTFTTTGTVFGNTLDRSTGGTLLIGATATTLDLCNSTACDNINMGANADADTITIGSAVYNDTTTVNGAFTNTNGSTSNTVFNLSSTGDFVIQDNGTSFFNISDTRAFSYTMDAVNNPNFSVNNLGAGDITFRDNGNAVWTIGGDASVSIVPGGVVGGSGNASDVNISLDDNSNLILTGTLTSTGASMQTISMTLGNDADADTISGILLNITSAVTSDADIIYGFNAGDITSASATVNETAIHVGTGWDYGAVFESGNVGIGTTTPSSKLTISGGSAPSTYLMNSANFGAGKLVLIGETNSIFDGLRVMNGDGTAGSTSRISLVSSIDPFNDANAGKVFIDAIRTATNMDFAISLNDASGAAPVERFRINGAGNVGIGTATPGAKLEINDSVDTGGGFFKPLRIYNPTLASGQTVQLAFGQSNNTYNQAEFNFNYVGGSGSSNNTLSFGLFGVPGILTIEGTGNVGIGNTDPSYLLHVGTNSATGAVARFQNSTGTCDINPTTTSLSCSSDINLKKNITELDNMDIPYELKTDLTTQEDTILDKVLAITPVTYNWNSENDTDPKHVGFIAQEIEQVFPDLVSTDGQGRKSLNYIGLVPYTIKAVQEMNVRIAALPEFEDQTMAQKVAEFLRGIAERGEAVISSIKTQRVHTEELCVGTEGDEVCVTKDQLQNLLNNTSASAGGNPTPAEPTPTPDQGTDTGTSGDSTTTGDTGTTETATDTTSTDTTLTDTSSTPAADAGSSSDTPSI